MLELAQINNLIKGNFVQDIYEKMGLFYLGKDSQSENLTLYKSNHLTTHAMIIGMTGSGKTGVGIGLIEEAAIDNIPSIVIDPKGDMANLCLAFPTLQPEEFEPWIDPSEAANKGKTTTQFAQEVAQTHQAGLASFWQDASRVEKFSKIEKTIYTPGSSAGIGVNILGSFAAPSEEILDDADMLSSLINSTVSSILALISIEADPINSKEHLLLSNIFHYYYSRGISLSLEEIIGHVASPPFEKIGMLLLKSFYNQNERMKLAQALNGIISSVAFSSWIQGEALDIQNMLYDAEGKAKIAIFSIAHLSDNERMFFVTILLNAYISWMRKQRGSSSLKAILYMDEIFGFFPPSKNPPSKQPMLLLLKQARAFGTGIILSTQNPIDLDYKGLSNIGTWFVGKLQTQQDIQRVIDPLAAKSQLSKEELTKKLTTLKGRHFLLKNVHAEETIEFRTRWVLSYLKGPLTKDDIRLLMKEKKNKMQEQNSTQIQSGNTNTKSNASNSQKPILSESIKEYFLDTNINSQAPFYPSLYASTKIRFYNQKRAIDIEEKIDLKLELDNSHNIIDWEKSREELCEGFANKPSNNASYSELPTIIIQAKTFKEFEKNLSDYLYGSKKLELYICNALKLESKLHQSKRDFIVEVEDRLKELRDEKVDGLKDKFQVKYNRLEDKLQQLEFKLEKEKHDVSSKTTDTLMDIGLAVINALFGGKTPSASSSIRDGASAFRKGRDVLKEKDDVKNVSILLDDTKYEMQELQEQLKEEIIKIEDELDSKNYEITPLFITPRRSDIIIKDIALLWEK